MSMNSHGSMDQFTAHLDRGWDLVSRGDFAGALVSAQQGCEIDESSPEVHNLLGFIHAAEGRSEDALTHYRQAVELDDTFVEAMLNAAEILIHPLADFDEALRLIDDALELMDETEEITDASLLKIDVLLARGDRDGAATVARRLPTGPFERPGLSLLVGRAKIEVGDIEGGAAHILAAAETDPGSPDTQYYLGVVLEARGDTHGATIAYLRCREGDLGTPPPAWSLPPEQFERQVQRALGNLTESDKSALDGALVVVVDAPGAEVVADGVDPRAEVLLDVGRKDDGVTVTRVFVYQRNIERGAGGAFEIEDAVVEALSTEIAILAQSATDESTPSSPPPSPL